MDYRISMKKQIGKRQLGGISGRAILSFSEKISIPYADREVSGVRK
jgi:hypothetical protein